MLEDCRFEIGRHRRSGRKRPYSNDDDSSFFMTKFPQRLCQIFTI